MHLMLNYAAACTHLCCILYVPGSCGAQVHEAKAVSRKHRRQDMCSTRTWGQVAGVHGIQLAQ